MPPWAADAVAIRDASPSLMACQVANALMARLGIETTGQRVKSVLTAWDGGQRP
jgi:hypothetical protein